MKTFLRFFWKSWGLQNVHGFAVKTCFYQSKHLQLKPTTTAKDSALPPLSTTWTVRLAALFEGQKRCLWGCLGLGLYFPLFRGLEEKGQRCVTNGPAWLLFENKVWPVCFSGNPLEWEKRTNPQRTTRLTMKKYRGEIENFWMFVKPPASRLPVEGAVWAKKVLQTFPFSKPFIDRAPKKQPKALWSHYKTINTL